MFKDFKEKMFIMNAQMGNLIEAKGGEKKKKKKSGNLELKN